MKHSVNQNLSVGVCTKLEEVNVISLKSMSYNRVAYDVRVSVGNRNVLGYDLFFRVPTRANRVIEIASSKNPEFLVYTSSHHPNAYSDIFGFSQLKRLLKHINEFNSTRHPPLTP
jgi:hypothetical protein